MSYLDAYPAHPAMQGHRRRAYLMGWRSAARSTADDSAVALARWQRRHQGTDVARCEQDWLDGWHDSVVCGARLDCTNHCI